MNKSYYIALCFLGCGILMGLCSFFVVPDMNIKVMLMLVAGFDLVIATLFIGRAFRR